MRPRPAGALGWTESRSRVSSAGAGHDDEGAHMAKYPHDSQTALFNMSAVMYGGGKRKKRDEDAEAGVRECVSETDGVETNV